MAAMVPFTHTRSHEARQCEDHPAPLRLARRGALLSLGLGLCAGVAIAAGRPGDAPPALPAANALVVVLPPAPAADAAIDHALVARVLRGRLAQVPYRVATLSDENYAALLAQAVAAVNADARKGAPLPRADVVARVMSMLAQAICEELNGQLVLQVRVVRRPAMFQGRFVDWDGVRIPVRDLVEVEHAFRFEMEGRTTAWSVEVAGFAANGELAFLTHGGLALAFDPDARRSPAVPLLSRLKDEAAVRVAVDAALAQAGLPK